MKIIELYSYYRYLDDRHLSYITVFVFVIVFVILSILIITVTFIIITSVILMTIILDTNIIIIFNHDYYSYAQ